MPVIPKALDIAVHERVPTIGKAMKSLAAMERELTTAKTCIAIAKIIREATALKVLLGQVDEVKRWAEDTILAANVRIGEEIKKIPKAHGGGRGLKSPARGLSKAGRGAVEVPPTSRKRMTKLADAGKDAVKKAAQELRREGKDATPRAVATLLTQGDKKERRDQREVELGANALPDKRYGVILADPPYRHEPWSRETGMDRAADNHYPTWNSIRSKRSKYRQPKMRCCSFGQPFRCLPRR
jgi:hypothetical protein